jgi:hypothetical protein
MKERNVLNVHDDSSEKNDYRRSANVMYREPDPMQTVTKRPYHDP